MESQSKESRIQLALDAYKKGRFKTLKAAALAFDIPRTTLQRRIGGIESRIKKPANCQKLSKTEESTLSTWILDMDKRGLPVQLSTVHHLAELLLSARLPSQPAIIGEHWVNRFIKRHPELKSKYTRKYDYQQAKCEDPNLIQAWFTRVKETIQRYGILEEDIYNIDETGFQMGVASTAKVVCGSETRDSYAKALQPGNREWVTAIICINAKGWTLPPQIIFAAANHQSLWYYDLPDDYVISVSKNGWTTDELGYEWLQKVFEPYTASRTIGRYRLLILDGHSSHATAEFDKFCMERRIIPLYMPPHSSHLLQPLDVACFSPLKHIYGQQTQDLIRKGIHSVGKEDFLYIYPAVHQKALSSSNIISGFTATGLIPFSPERVFSKLKVLIKTPTPPSSSHSNQSFGTGKTPFNTYQLEKQKQRIESLKGVVSPSVVEEAMRKIIKGAEMTMQNALLLQQEIDQLQSENQYRRRRKARTRQFIQNGGSLMVSEAREQAQREQEQEQGMEEVEYEIRQRRPPKCSNCGVFGHNRRKCPSR